MKKVYSKPDIFFEDFSLTTNIAAGCEEKPFDFSERCGVKWSKGQILFDDSFENCTKDIINGASDYNQLCYHNPYDHYNVFYS